MPYWMEGAKTLANSALHALLHIGIDEGGGGGGGLQPQVIFKSGRF